MLTDSYREDEIQALVILAELEFPVDSPNNNFYKPFPGTISEAQNYFRDFRVDPSSAFIALQAQGLVQRDRDFWKLTPDGKETAEKLRKARPPIFYWYRDYYTAVDKSEAFTEYSRRVFGKDLAQHGFSDMAQLQLLLDKVNINAGSSVLDLGCGSGKIAEYISDVTGAGVTGIDYVPEAIEIARKHTANKSDRLSFQTGDIENPVGENVFFDLIISVDSIYFSDANILLSCWRNLLKPGGRMAVFYVSPDGGNLSSALTANGLFYDVYDISRENWEHMQLKYTVAGEMKQRFESEGNLFIWDNIMKESILDMSPYNPEKTTMRRYLYLIHR